MFTARSCISCSRRHRLASIPGDCGNTGGLLCLRPLRSLAEPMDNDLLRAVSILRDLSDAELDMIANLLTVKEAKKGDKLLEEGAVVNHLYIVCDGAVHVRRLAQTREILLGRLGIGAHFGEINMFDPGTATASIYA